MKKSGDQTPPLRAFAPKLGDLLDPARAFRTPLNVVNDADLTLDEKRSILASWASDACAVEAAPALRRIPGGGRIVTIDEILEALQTLDRQARDGSQAWTRRQMRRAAFESFRESRGRQNPA